MQKCHEFVIALEEERRKILMFQRELPLCLDLVTQAIDNYKREFSGTTMDCVQGNSDCSDQTSSGAPVLEEFIPISREEKGKVDDDEEDDRLHTEEHRWLSNGKKSSVINSGNSSDKDFKRKADWLRSAQLWKEPSDPSLSPDTEEERSKGLGIEVGSNRGAFQPFQRNKSKNAETTSSRVVSSCPSPSSSAETNGSGGCTTRIEDKGTNQLRKQRRCWSPELHRRFLHALHQLGGSHVATPKQIRELMKVEGLTNDEVKSHLQKYRLHTRRPSPVMPTCNGSQPPQFVVVGGIWVPPPEYQEIPGSDPGREGVSANSKYASGASTPTVSMAPESDDLQLLQRSEEGDSRKEGEGGQTDSTSTSSSTRTTTSSPV